MSDILEPRANAVQPQPNKKKPETDRAVRNILEVATKEFSEKGLAGARIDEIAEKTNYSKRMIYYHFRDKNDLYLRCLEEEYKRIRADEEALDLDGLSAVAALTRIIEFRVNHHFNNQDFVRLVMIENIHGCQFLDMSETIRAISVNSIGATEAVYNRGVDEGVFRPGIAPIDIQWMIAAMSFFSISNQTSFAWVFDLPPYDEAQHQTRRAFILDAVLNHLMVR